MGGGRSMFGNWFSRHARKVRRSGFRLSVVLISAAFAAACQTAAVGTPELVAAKQISLEEAKRISARFANNSLSLPPRSAFPIIELFDPSRDPYDACSVLLDASALSIRKRWPREAKPGLKPRFSVFTSRGQKLFRLGNTQKAADFHRLAISEYWEPNSARWRAAFSHITDAEIYSDLATYLATTGNHVAAAEALDDATSILRSSRTNRSEWIRSHANRAHGAIARSRGELNLAEAYYRRAISEVKAAKRLIGHNDKKDLLNIEQAELAGVLLRQGRLVEAENVVRESLRFRLDRSLKFSVETAFIFVHFAEILYAQGRYAEAIGAAETAIKLYRKVCAPDDSLFIAESRRIIGGSLAVLGKWKEALEQFESIARDLTKQPDVLERRFADSVSWAIALLKVGRAAEAIPRLETAIERQRQRLGADHFKVIELTSVLALARNATGDAGTARDVLSAEIPRLLSAAWDADDEGITFSARDRRLEIILGDVMALLAEDGDPGSIAWAFELAETARSGSVRRGLAASMARSAVSDPELADFIRREQDLRKKLAAVRASLGNLFQLPLDQQPAEVVEALRSQIQSLHQAHIALRKEIGERFPDYAELINPKPATVEEARAVLRHGETLISTYVGEAGTYVWAIPQSGDVAFAAVDLGREALSEKVGLLRSSLEPNAATLGDIPDFDVAAAHELFKQLLEPVKAGWKNATNLLVVAHGPLGHLPLSVLPTEPAALSGETEPLFSNYRDVPWLARTHSVTVLPSVASLRALRGLPPGRRDRRTFAGFGDPWFSAEQAQEAEASGPTEVAELANRGLTVRGLPLRLRAGPGTSELDSAELARLPRLPDTADEVRGIALALKADLAEDVFLGRRANEGAVKTINLSGYRVLSFATHGLVPGDLNGLTQPALALSAPEVSGDTDNDGLLTMGEILGLELDADWVVLSACNTASGEGAGGEAVSGLGRAFFYAGTRALLVSNWPVETTSAKALTTDVFRRQAADGDLTRAEALRQSMLALIDGSGYVDTKTGNPVFSYAHPIFWAPFSLIGDGGGARPQS